MNRIYLLLLFAFAMSSAGFAQNQPQKIEVKILHNDEVYFDTVLRNQNNTPEKIIREIVSRYSTEKVYLDASRLHGLYVFNISDEHWKGNRSSQKRDVVTNEIEINLDSLLNQFRRGLEKQWKDLDRERMKDSVDKTLDDLKNDLKTLKQEADPHWDAFKEDMKEMMEKIRKTRIVIVQEGDTIRID